MSKSPQIPPKVTILDRRKRYDVATCQKSHPQLN